MELQVTDEQQNRDQGTGQGDELGAPPGGRAGQLTPVQVRAVSGSKT